MKGTAVHVLVKSALGIVGIYLCYCAFLFLMQRQIMYPRSMIEPPPGDLPHVSGMEKIWLETDFGKVETWYLRPGHLNESGPSPVVIFAHGNAELIDFMPEELSIFTELGIGVLLVEYPGYGRSQGSPSQQSITQTFVKAYDMITARKDVDSTRIILFGRSLGGGAVCALARKRSAAALILMSAFTSARSFAPKYLVPGLLIRDPFDNLSVVSAFKGPVLVMHGKTDEIIPYRHGVTLARAATHGTLLSYACGHNDFPPGWFGFKEKVETFLENAGILATGSAAEKH